MKKTIILVAIVVGLLIVGFLAIKQFKAQKGRPSPESSLSPTPLNGKLKVSYTSKAMAFIVEVPRGYEVKEKLGGIEIKSLLGPIYIDRNGTNFDDLNAYLEDLSERNNYNLESRESIKINNLQAIKGKIDSRRIYFIYVNNIVYTIFTDEVSLYDDLDQIAQSFRYTP